MTASVPITDAEWDVMEAIWEADSSTAAAVIERLSAKRQWNHRTVRTLLARLVEKGALAYEVDGARYIYRAAISRKQCVRHEGRSFAEKVFGGDVGELVAHFVSAEKLDEDDIERLRNLLDEKVDQKRAKATKKKRAKR